MTIRSFRDYSEHEVVNLFAMNEDSNKGTFVTAIGEGFNSSSNPVFGDDSNLDGSISARFNVPHLVEPAPSGTPKHMVLGMTLKDVRQRDENGYPLKWEPRKAAERDYVISGQSLPIVKRGVFLYSGIEGDTSFGDLLSVSSSGDGALEVLASTNPSNPLVVAKALGPKDNNGYTLIQIDL